MKNNSEQNHLSKTMRDALDSKRSHVLNMDGHIHALAVELLTDAVKELAGNSKQGVIAFQWPIKLFDVVIDAFFWDGSSVQIIASEACDVEKPSLEGLSTFELMECVRRILEPNSVSGHPYFVEVEAAEEA